MTNHYDFFGKTANYIGQNDDESEEPEESGSEFQDSDDEPSESDEESDGEDEVVGRDGEEKQDDDRLSDSEMPTKSVKTENRFPDEEVHVLDDPVGSSQRTIKREHDLDYQIENEVNMATAPYESRNPVQTASPVITLSSEKDGVLYEAASSALEQKNSRVSCYGLRTKKVKTEHLVPDAEVYTFGDPIKGSQSPDESEQVGELLQDSNTVSSANLKLVYDVEYQEPY